MHNYLYIMRIMINSNRGMIAYYRFSQAPLP